MAEDDIELRETPLADAHRRLGAKLVPFAGWNMPLQYDGVIDEHRRVRDSVGVFDVGHMGTVFVRGEGTDDFLQRMLTNDVSKADVGRAQYTLLCNDSGGVIDDLIISHLDDDEWMIVPNAANTPAVTEAITAAAADHGVRVVDVSDRWGIIAVQGPLHKDVLAEVLPGVDVARFGVRLFETEKGYDGILTGTGYTGSPGVEIVAPAETCVELWHPIIESASAAGGGPAGLGARDTLRLEMGYPLHGQDIAPDISPLEAGLGWVVKLDTGPFPGSAALRAQKESGIPRKRIGLLTPDRRPPRRHCSLLAADGGVVGEVTSGGYSPILERGIGLGLVARDAEPVAVDIRGRTVEIETQKPPFVEPPA